jgi:hypothetical protein
MRADAIAGPRPVHRFALLIVTVTVAMLSVLFGLSSPASANNDEYCGHGEGHTAYHQWHTYKWKNIWVNHDPPVTGWSGHYNHYIKKRQPSYYDQWPLLSGIWLDGGEIWKSGPGCE